MNPLLDGYQEHERQAEQAASRRDFPAELIQRMVRAAIVNEAAKVLADGIARRPLDIDVVLLHGYGYPIWRGGPMFEADMIGLDRILADIEEAHRYAGKGYEPAPLILALARDKRRFADLAPGEAARRA